MQIAPPRRPVAAVTGARQGIGLGIAEEIRPGIIRTAMTAPAAPRYDALIAAGLTPIARWGETGDVGATVAALASGRLPFSTGQAYHVDGGMHIHKL